MKTINLAILVLFLATVTLYSQFINTTSAVIFPHNSPGNVNTALDRSVRCLDFAPVDNGSSLDLILGENMSAFSNPRTWASYKLNDGSGNFTGSVFDFDSQDYVVDGWTARDIEFGQLRPGNPRKDIAVSRGGCVQIFHNNGQGGIQFGHVQAVAGQSNSVSWGYMQPGSFTVQDIVNAENNGIYIFYNDGQGNLNTSGYLVGGSPGFECRKVIAKYLRNPASNKQDIVTYSTIASPFSSRIRIYRNNGFQNITLLTEINYGTSSIQDFDLGDIDNDGDIDLVVLTSIGGAQRELRGYLNDGAGNISTSHVFSLPVVYTNGYYIKLGDMADPQLDGLPEVAICGYGGHIIILKNRGASNGYYSYPFGSNQEFTSSPGTLFERSAKDMVLADIQGNGGLGLGFCMGMPPNYPNATGVLVIHKSAFNPAPLAPSITSQEVLNARACIYFANNGEPDFAGYNVYLSINGGAWVKQNIDPITASNYTDYNYIISSGSGLGEPMDELNYCIKAVDTENNESGESNYAYFYTNCLQCDNPVSSNNKELEFKSSNYPNPFNPSTVISYTIPQSSLVMVKIYNSLGQEIKTLVNEFKQFGNYQTTFDASNLPSGMYFYRITAGNYSETKKIILVK